MKIPIVFTTLTNKIVVYSPQHLEYMMVNAISSIEKKKKQHKRKMNKSTNYMKNILRRQSDKVIMDRSASFMTPIK
jgi:glutamine amidotransferase-like uncharacterized protein